MDKALCVGIGLAPPGNELQVDVRRHGRQMATIRFRNDPAGVDALADFICGWTGSARIAITSFGAAAIAIGLALGAAPGRQVFLVAPMAATQAADLARYAESII